MIKPILYKLEEDTSIRHKIDFENSIFTMGVDKIYDLPKYRVLLRETGIDFHSYGKTSSINKSTAISVF